MPCSLSATQAAACTSGIGKVQDSTMLLQLIAQLTCEAAEAGGGGGGGVTQFIQLTDAPNSYAGQAGLGVRVNAGATGLEFYTISSGIAQFDSGNVALDGVTTAYTVAHGLAGVPKMVNVVLACTVNDAGTGYLAGDETDVTSWFNNGVALPAFAVTRNATNIIVSLGNGNVLVGNEATFTINTRNGTGLANPTTFNNFALKVYAWF